MANLTYNEILFSNVNKWDDEGSYKGILIAGKLNQKNGQDYKLIDSIDIDWNGGWLRSLNTYLNTTEDLLMALDEINKNDTVDNVETAVAQMRTLLSEIANAYVSTAYLGEVLTAYQNTLVPGYHITIDNDNIITAYGFVDHDELYSFSSAYATNIRVNQIESDLWDQFYTKSQVEDIAHEEAIKAMNKIVDGADEAFDTLREVAEWINGQNRYEETPYSELVRDGEVIVDYDVYIYKQETDEYIKVSEEFILNNPDEIYYRICNTATDVADLFNAIMQVQNQVGYKTDNGDNTYTYTGLLLDIYNLQQTDSDIYTEISSIYSGIDDITRISEYTNKLANQAYNAAYSSYDLAAYSLQITVDGINMAYTAYTVANDASVKVGTSSTPKFWRTITDEEREGLTNGTLSFTVYVWNDIQESYNVSEFNPDSSEEYWIEDPGTEATGLTKRVEDAEKHMDEVDTRVEHAEHAASTALFNLHINNTDSEFVTLGLTPQLYDNDPDRILSITTTDAKFDENSGILTQDGIITASVATQIYSYMSSWVFFMGRNDDTEEPKENNG